MEVAESYLGAKHAICITLNNSLISAKKSAQAAQFKANKGVKGKTGDSHADAKTSKKITGANEQKFNDDINIEVPNPNAPKPYGHK